MEFLTRVLRCITRIPALCSGRAAQVAPPLEYNARAHSRLIDKEQSAMRTTLSPPPLTPSVRLRAGCFIRYLRESKHEPGAIVVKSAVCGHY